MKYLGDNMWVDAEGHSGHAYEWNGSKTVKVFAGGKQVEVQMIGSDGKEGGTFRVRWAP